jgi:hypothetical protein
MNASAREVAFRHLVSQLREQHAARLETFVGPDAPVDDTPKDAFKTLTYQELATVCGCGVKRFAPCPICAAVDLEEERQRRYDHDKS